MNSAKTLKRLRRKATVWAWILSFMPGVAAIFLSGSLAQAKAHQNSDIDFFIITYPGKIWTARFFVFLILKITRNLAKPAHHKGRICPNHFVTTQSLEISDKNAYTADLFTHNQPLYDPDNWFQAFALANQGWVIDHKAKFPVQIVDADFKPPERSPNKSWLESLLQKWQTKKIKRNPESQLPGAEIVLSDKELRFHPQPKSRHWGKKATEIDLLEIHNPYDSD